MKRTLLAASLLAVVALAPAQSRYSLSEAFDAKLRATTVVRATAETNARIGMGVTHTWRRRFDILDRFAPTLSLTVGPWLNYGTGAGKMSGGLYIGAGVAF